MNFIAEKAENSYSEVRPVLERGRKRRLRKAGMFAVIFSLAAGSLWYFIKVRPIHSKMEDEISQNDRGDTVTVTGVTETGTDNVTFTIDFLENTSLFVEEVYLSSGDSVEAGEKCVKFTQDSIDKARAELETAVRDAELAYRSKVISDGEDRIRAKYTYDKAVLEAKYAAQVYQDTLTQLEMQVVKAENAYKTAQEEYNTYALAVENNTFYEDYQIEKLKKAYDDAYDLYVSRGQYWEVTQEELGALSGVGQSAQSDQSDRQWIIRTAALLKEEMAEARQEYEQARQDYQREIEGAELKLQKLLNQFERAEHDYTDAKLSCQRGSLHAKTLYELTAAKGQMAENDYNVRLMSLSDELERQKDAWDEAVWNKELFEQTAGDGYWYAEHAGTVAAVRAQQGQALGGGDVLFAYGNPEEIFVSAAVPKEDIAKLSVGDAASVTIPDCGSFDGVVEAVRPTDLPGDPAPGWGTVTVSLEGDVSTVGANLAAKIAFGENTQSDAIAVNAAGHGTEETGGPSQMFDLVLFSTEDDGNTESLKVEEMYVEEGQRVRKGEPVCRFTQDSIERVRKALTYAQSEAQIALMKAQTDYHVGVLAAGLSHNEAMMDAAFAQTVYDNTIAGMNRDMAAKTLEIEQLLADIYQMQLSLTADSYTEQRADIARAYDKAKRQAEQSGESFVTSQVEALETLLAAKEAYDDFFSQFEVSSQQIADMVEKVYAIQDEILQSQQLMEMELVSAEQARSSAQTRGETAGARYAGSVKAYENAVRKAKADLDSAMQQLDDFNRFIKDGTVCAAGDGIVVKTGCREGDLIADTRQLVSFMADEDMTDSAKVPQEDTQ